MYQWWGCCWETRLVVINGSGRTTLLLLRAEQNSNPADVDSFVEHEGNKGIEGHAVEAPAKQPALVVSKSGDHLVSENDKEKEGDGPFLILYLI